MNKFEQLEQDIVDGALSIKQVGIAVRSAVRRMDHLPEGVRDLLGGRSAQSSGLLAIHFRLIEQTIGHIELAYRRGES